MSTTARPIKVTKEVPGILKSFRANQITKSRENTDKVFAVVAVMTVFKKNKNNTMLSSRKSANQATLKQINTKSRPYCTSKYNKSTSKGLIAKTRTIRVLLDSGSSGDLLFLKKGAPKD